MPSLPSQISKLSIALWCKIGNLRERERTLNIQFIVQVLSISVEFPLYCFPSLTMGDGCLRRVSGAGMYVLVVGAYKYCTNGLPFLQVFTLPGLKTYVKASVCTYRDRVRIRPLSA